MEFEKVLEKVIALAREQFEAGSGEIGEESTASDLARWNSLTHVMLVSSIEKTYGIKFDLMDMIEMKNIGDIARATHEAIQ